MKKVVFIFLCLPFLSIFGQIRKIQGNVIDPSGKKSSISVCVSENSNSAQLKCIDTKPDGSFEISIPDHLKKPPYKLTIIVIGRPKKEYLIYDTTKLPIKIVLENAQSVYEKLDKPKYDPAVKLRKFEHGEASGADDNTQKTFKRNSNAETHELTLIYNAFCGLEFKPTIKFASDTLFIESDKGKAPAGDKCSCESKLYVSGLKTKKYAVIFNGEAFTEKE